MTERPAARFVKPGEMLAMDPSVIRSGPEGFFWLFGGGPAASEQRGDVAIVHVRDALEHHADSWGDSYEGILQRVRDAMAGKIAVLQHERAQRQHRWEHEHEEGFEPLPDVVASPPAAVLLCIDSPGGVVSGLNETVFALQKLKEETGIPLVAYINEMAASAAYALTCACKPVVCPPSAIVGSIGVISTMISQAERNKRDGFDVRLITSGARKADGHLHAPITDAAIAAETSRVNKLAATFFKIASKARGISAATIEGFQAGIYLGKDAERRKLVDEVACLDDVILALSKASADGSETAGGNETDRRASKSLLDGTAQSGSLRRNGAHGGPSRPNEARTMLTLTALIKRTEAAISKETDEKKRKALAAVLAVYKKTEKHIEHHKTEEDDGEDEPENGDDGDGDEDDEEKKSAKKAEEEMAAKKAEEEAAAKKAEEDEEEEAEEKKAAAALRLIEAATGMTGRKAVGAAAAMFATAKTLAADVEVLKRSSLADRKAALLKEAAPLCFGKAEEEWLATQSRATLEGWLEMRRAAGPVIHTSEGTIVKPKVVKPGTEESLPEEVRELIDAACEASGLADSAALRAELVKAHLKSHTDRIKSAANGAGRI